jgi:uncharacterized protein YybS (DUF2232 family)
LISGAYALIVLVLLVPGARLIVPPAVPSPFWVELYADVTALYQEEWIAWIPIAIVLSGQALLLFLSVDTSWRRLKPRAHVLVSCSVTAMLVALLTCAVLFSLAAGVYGDDPLFAPTLGQVLAVWAFLWLLWGFLFYRHVRDSTDVVSRAVSWLIKGSVLELLIAVPCHIVVRARGDCSAPAVTGFGITTGIAIMLLAFGPSVLLLYKKRLDGYSKRASEVE